MSSVDVDMFKDSFFSFSIILSRIRWRYQLLSKFDINKIEKSSSDIDQEDLSKIF